MKEKGPSKMSTISVKGNMAMQMKVIGYWATTTIVALELLAGGVTDLVHGPVLLFVGQPVVEVLAHLGSARQHRGQRAAMTRARFSGPSSSPSSLSLRGHFDRKAVSSASSFPPGHIRRPVMNSRPCRSYGGDRRNEANCDGEPPDT